jgi:menaquinol-cytochrome c reductase iron-sulfur subunit
METQVQSQPIVAPCEQDEVSRRNFFMRVTIAAGTAIAALVSLPVLGFVLAPLVRKPPVYWRAVGPVESFQIGQTVKVDFTDPSPLPWSGITAKTAAWLRRVSDSEFIAFSINCRHLGCPVRWLDGAKLFMCPCHGGVYYEDGSVAAGPPPQPLARYEVRVNNGQVEIETSPIPLTTFKS